MRIGDIDVLPVRDGFGIENARSILRRTGVDDAWGCHAHHLDPSGKLKLEVGGFLVVSPGRVVLVDAGVGPAERPAARSGYRGGDLLESLASYGFAPEDVTDVVFSHLHFDHVGWASRAGKPTFPKAVYRAHGADWSHFVTNGHGRPQVLETLEPIAGRLATFDRDGALAPGISARHAPGHTPGSTVFIVSDRGERVLLLGDVVHSVVELHERDWEAVFDVDPVAASAVRNAIADDAAGTRDLVGGPHFPGLRFGRIVLANGERAFRPL